MKTNILWVSASPEELETPLDIIERSVLYTGMSRRGATNMCLPVAKLLGVTKGIVGSA